MFHNTDFEDVKNTFVFSVAICQIRRQFGLVVLVGNLEKDNSEFETGWSKGLQLQHVKSLLVTRSRAASSKSVTLWPFFEIP